MCVQKSAIELHLPPPPPAFSPQGNRDESKHVDQGLAQEDAKVSAPFAAMSRQFAALFPNCFSFKLGIT